MAEERSFMLLGDQIDILVSGDMSAGRSTTFTETVPPGGGPPPHSHKNEDETFFVLEGEFAFTESGKTVKRSAGESFHGARGLVHGFRNSGATTGKLLIFVAPAGLERFFDEIRVLDLPRDVPKMIDIAGRYGIEFAAPN